MCREIGLGLAQRDQALLPVPFEAASDESVLRFHDVELTTGPLGFEASPFDVEFECAHPPGVVGLGL